MAKKKKKQEKEEFLTFENGQPCGDKRCGKKKMRNPCTSCGRIAARGTAYIRIRTGPVYLERVTPINIKNHIAKTKKKQEKGDLTIWLSPESTLDEYTL